MPLTKTKRKSKYVVREYLTDAYEHDDADEPEMYVHPLTLKADSFSELLVKLSDALGPEEWSLDREQNELRAFETILAIPNHPDVLMSEESIERWNKGDFPVYPEHIRQDCRLLDIEYTVEFYGEYPSIEEMNKAGVEIM
jgi:hypothetical protein